MALITTEGASNSDSLATLAEADSYLSASSYNLTTWEALSDSAKELRLKNGAMLMNTLPLRGAKACREQRLSFPRWWRTDTGFPLYEDTYITMADITSAGYTAPTIPNEAKWAQIEISFHVIHNGVFQLESMAYPEREIKSFALGGNLEIEFTDRPTADNSTLYKARLSSLDVAYYLLYKWLRFVSGDVI